MPCPQSVIGSMPMVREGEWASYRPGKCCLAPDDDVVLAHDVYSLYSSNVLNAVRLSARGVPHLACDDTL